MLDAIFAEINYTLILVPIAAAIGFLRILYNFRNEIKIYFSKKKRDISLFHPAAMQLWYLVLGILEIICAFVIAVEVSNVLVGTQIYSEIQTTVSDFGSSYGALAVLIFILSGLCLILSGGSVWFKNCAKWLTFSGVILIVAGTIASSANSGAIAAAVVDRIILVAGILIVAGFVRSLFDQRKVLVDYATKKRFDKKLLIPLGTQVLYVLGGAVIMMLAFILTAGIDLLLIPRELVNNAASLSKPYFDYFGFIPVMLFVASGATLSLSCGKAWLKNCSKFLFLAAILLMLGFYIFVFA